MRSRWGIVVRIGVSAVLLGLLARRLRWEQAWTVLASLRLDLFSLSVLLYIGGQLLSSYRWKVLLRPLRVSVAYSRLVAFYFLGMFFNFFLPTVIGGDAVKAYYLARETGSATSSVASVFMDRNTGLLALLLLAVGGAAVSDLRMSHLPLVYPLLGGLLVYGAANFVLFRDSTYRWLDGWLQRLHHGVVGQLRSVIRQWRDACGAYRHSPGVITAAVGVSLLFDLLLIGATAVTARALGIAVSPISFFVFIPIISVMSMIPVTVYGLGVREYGFVLFFSDVGVPAEACLLLSLVWMLVTVAASLPGAVIYVGYRRSCRTAQRGGS
jgi:hypothetical protein